MISTPEKEVKRLSSQTHLVELDLPRERMLKSVKNTNITQVRQRLNDYSESAEIALIGFAVKN